MKTNKSKGNIALTSKFEERKRGKEKKKEGGRGGREEGRGRKRGERKREGGNDLSTQAGQYQV